MATFTHMGQTIESDAGDYLLEVANELLPEAMEEARKRIADLQAVLEG